MPELQYSPADEQLVDVGQYFRAAWRQLPVVILAIVLGGLAGFAYAGLTPASYSATAVVNVPAQPTGYGASGTVLTAPNMDSETAIAMSPAVTVPAAAKLPGVSVGAFLADANASYPRKATTLALAYSAGTPAAATLGAQSWAEAFIAWHQQHDSAILKAHVAQTTATMKAPLAAIDKAQKAANAATAGTATATRLDAEVQGLNAQIAPLRAQLDALNSAVVNPGTLVGPVQQPTQADGFSKSFYVLIGALIGLIAGIAAAVAIEGLRDRVRTTGDLGRAAKVSVWADLSGKGRANAVQSISLRLAALVQRDRVGSVLVMSLESGAVDIAPLIATELHRSGVSAQLVRDIESTLELAPMINAAAPSSVVLVAVDNAAHDPRAMGVAASTDAALLLVEAKRTSRRRVRSAVRDLEDAGARVVGLVLTPSMSRAERSRTTSVVETESEAPVPTTTNGTRHDQAATRPADENDIGSAEEPSLEHAVVSRPESGERLSRDRRP